MNAVILAAGTGSRLRPLTIDQPKACVTVDSIPIGEHQLRAYDAAGFETVYVVTGYMADRIEALCDRLSSELSVDIEVLHNEAFANTDNMYSLYCARKQVAGEPFVLSNGDVVFEPEVIERLAAIDDHSGIAVDAEQYDPEAMKITVDEGGAVDGISKDFSPEEAAATSIDCYRFSAVTSAKLFDRIVRRIEIDEEYTAWTELALDELLQTGSHDVQPVDIEGAEWVEIDEQADLLAADRTFSSLGDLRSKDAVFFDLDGTIYLDETPIDGAVDVVDQLRAAGVDVYFLSNNSSRWKPTYADRLASLGIDADPDEIILSTDGVIDYLRTNGIEASYVVGTEAMRGAISEAGIEPAATDPETVVVGFDRELTYEKVAAATLAIREGAEFLVAHGDRVCPTEAGLVPDCGSIAALVETATGREPSHVFGKPSVGMVDHVLEREGYDPSEVVIVGDRLSTDIELAERLGCGSVSVLSGETTRRDIETADQQPSLVVDSVGELFAGDPVETASVAESTEL
ncbi:HAD-IIA family hydrolase [Halohasta litorea]|uniref:HAD-IIA family hydrolase n=1 Tax=Halohasta litorea TaxID=869891 RepID=A0ABD6D2M5_9EURY|nr:HAD-IIA family hydrolase [Halohasta litorea]